MIDLIEEAKEELRRASDDVEVKWSMHTTAVGLEQKCRETYYYRLGVERGLQESKKIDIEPNIKEIINQCHEIKVWPPYFQQTADGNKTWELRVDDRDYHVGDILVMKEWVPAITSYTGRVIEARVTYIVKSSEETKFFALPSGMCIMTINVISERDIDGNEVTRETKGQ